MTLLWGGMVALTAHQDHAMVWFFTPFEIAPTRVYYRELLVHSLEKEVIREGEGVCEGQNLEAERR